MSRPTATYPVVTEESYPAGLRCCDCQRSLDYGTPYKEQVVVAGDLEAEPETFAEHVAAAGIARIICVYCGVEVS